MSQFESVDFFGISFFAETKKAFLVELENLLRRSWSIQIATVNPEFLVEAEKSPEFQSVLSGSLCVADGNGIVWWQAVYSALERDFRSLAPLPGFISNGLFGLRVFVSLVRFLILGKPSNAAFPEIIPGSELVYDLCDLCQRLHLKVALVGAMPGVAAMAKEKLQVAYPKLEIPYADEWFFRPEDKQKCLDALVASGAEVVCVAFGAPKQEMFIANDLLPSVPSVRLAIGLGWTFDFIAEIVPRSPWLFRTLKLEWLFRLALQPKRFKRIFRAVAVFPYILGRRIIRETRSWTRSS